MFRYWDSDGKGSIPVDKFFEKMVYYGVAPNELLVEKSIKNIMTNFKIEAKLKTIKEKHFLSLIEENRYTKPLINLITTKITD